MVVFVLQLVYYYIYHVYTGSENLKYGSPKEIKAMDQPTQKKNMFPVT